MTVLVAALLLARPSKPIAELLFELRRNQIWLRAELDGKPIRALLDTGAGSSALDVKAAAAAGIVKGKPKKFVGVGGSMVTGWTSKGRDVELYGTEVSTPITDILPLNALDPDESIPNAVFGFDFFHRMVVRIDYRARMVRLYDPATFEAPEGFEALPVQFIDKIPTVEGQFKLPGLDSKPVIVEFDTGSAFGIDVSYRVVRRDALDRKFPGEDDVSGGIGKPVVSRAIGVSQAELGALRLSAETRLFLTGGQSSIGPLRLPSGHDITLGNAALSRFDVVFDYPHAKVYLRRAE